MPLMHDHHRRENGVPRQRRGVLVPGHHQRDDQRHLDDGHGDRQHERAERLAHPVGHHLGMVDGGEHRAHEDHRDRGRDRDLGVAAPGRREHQHPQRWRPPRPAETSLGGGAHARTLRKSGNPADHHEHRQAQRLRRRRSGRHRPRVRRPAARPAARRWPRRARRRPPRGRWRWPAPRPSGSRRARGLSTESAMLPCGLVAIAPSSTPVITRTPCSAHPTGNLEAGRVERRRVHPGPPHRLQHAWGWRGQRSERGLVEPQGGVHGHAGGAPSERAARPGPASRPRRGR